MGDKLTMVNETLAMVTTDIDRLEAALKPAWQSALADDVKAYQERYGEAPAASWVERRQRQRQEAWATTAASAATAADLTYRHTLPIVEEKEREFQEPPDLVAALTHGGSSHSRSEYLAALGVDEQIQSRLRHELPGLSPAQVRVRYEAALNWPNDLRANATVRAVESGMLDGWLGVGGGTPEVAAQWQRLSDLVFQVRRSRIPQEVLRLRGAVEYARALAQHAHKDKGLPHWTEAPKESK